MLDLSQEFIRARAAGVGRRVLFTLTNAYGVRIYADRLPGDQAVGLKAAAVADGSFLADGGRAAGLGSRQLLERAARVLSFGTLRETLSPASSGLWASLTGSEPASLGVELSNSPIGGARPFSRLEAMENLLGAVGEISLGHAGLAARHYVNRFRGRVTAYRLEASKLTLTLRAL